MEENVDVIVIGAGGGGAVVAKELCEKGIKVLLLEAVPWYGNKQWPNPNTEPGAVGSSSYDDLDIDILNKCFTDLENDMNDLATGKFRWGPANRNQPPWPRTGGDWADILRKAGARTVIRSNWQPGVFLHILSTMRMGYVTDTNCEALQVKRLYIADNSILYNGLGGPNPTLTNQALATRTADKIAETYFTS